MRAAFFILTIMFTIYFFLIRITAVSYLPFEYIILPHRCLRTLLLQE